MATASIGAEGAETALAGLAGVQGRSSLVVVVDGQGWVPEADRGRERRSAVLARCGRASSGAGCCVPSSDRASSGGVHVSVGGAVDGCCGGLEAGGWWGWGGVRGGKWTPAGGVQRGSGRANWGGDGDARRGAAGVVDGASCSAEVVADCSAGMGRWRGGEREASSAGGAGGRQGAAVEAEAVGLGVARAVVGASEYAGCVEQIPDVAEGRAVLEGVGAGLAGSWTAGAGGWACGSTRAGQGGESGA